MFALCVGVIWVGDNSKSGQGAYKFAEPYQLLYVYWEDTLEVNF